MTPRASPWVVKFCPVGAGIREGPRHAAITFQRPPSLSCHGCRVPCAPSGQRISAQGATLGGGWWGCNRDTGGANECALKERRIPAQGATLGIGWWGCIRDMDGGYGGAPVWWLGRGMNPRASPWVVKFCPVGAGIREGSRHAPITFQQPPRLSCHEHRVPCAPLGQELVEGLPPNPRSRRPTSLTRALDCRSA